MRSESIRRTEFAVAILMTIVAVILFVVRATHAGGLWRDEAASVQLAQQSDRAAIFKEFSHEAFPPPFFLGLRVYAEIFGGNDAAFRGLGVVIGLALLAAIWINAWLLRSGAPLLLLILLGLNSTFLAAGTSIRAYGIGSAFLLLTLGLTVRTLQRPSMIWAVATAFAGIASMQLLLFNWVLLPVLALAALTNALMQRSLKLAGATVSIAALCALSALPWLGPYSAGKQWNMLQQGPLTVGLLWDQLALAFGDPNRVMIFVWVILFFALMIAGISRFFLNRQQPFSSEQQIILFGLVTLLASIGAYYSFLRFLSYGTQPWYYLALLAILAGAMDLVAMTFAHLPRIRIARLIFAVIALLGLPFADWSTLVERQTNIDLVASKLERVAKPGDLIVLNPWWIGISFNRYYHGAVEWKTLPTMVDHRIHRFDLIKAKMESPNPIDDLREAVSQTLQGNGHVWFVGGLDLPQPDETPPQLPASSDRDFKWNSDIYIGVWSWELGSFVQAHLLRMAVVPDPATGPVNGMEDVPLLGIEGWH